MTSRPRAGIAGILLGVAFSVLAAPADDAAARTRLRAERAALQAQFESAERDCVARDAARNCVDSARRVQRAALAPLRREEAALDAEQRRTQALARAAARAAPSPAQPDRDRREERSRQAYEARQRAAQAHRDSVAQRQAGAASTAEGNKPAAPLPVPAGAAPP